MAAYQENIRQLKAEIREQELTINRLRIEYCKGHESATYWVVRKTGTGTCDVCFIESPATYVNRRVVKTIDEMWEQAPDRHQTVYDTPESLCELCCFRTFNYLPCPLPHNLKSSLRDAISLVSSNPAGFYTLRPQEETEALLCRNRTKSARK